MPTRFFMPPEICAGFRCSKPVRPTSSAQLTTSSAMLGETSLDPGSQRHVLADRHELNSAPV